MGYLEVGKHIVRAIDSGLGHTDKGTQFVAIRFADDAGNIKDWQGYLSDKAITYTLNNLMKAGWDQSSQLNDLKFNGDRCQIVVEDESYNGKTFPKVKYINLHAARPLVKNEVIGAAADEVNQKARDSFVTAAAMFESEKERQKAFLESQQNQTNGTAPIAHPSGDAYEDDSLPF